MNYTKAPGRPRADGSHKDTDGNLRDKDGNIIEAAIRDIPEDEPEEPNHVAAASSSSDVAALREELAQLRAEIGKVQPTRVVPDGTWRVSYNRPELKVHGGVEVSHSEGFRPLPPASIALYEAVGGGTTNHIDAPYKTYYTFDEFGNPRLDDNGEPMSKKVPIGKSAKKDANGNPILTEEYKYWLHVRAQGKRLNSAVMSDIAAGKGVPGAERDPIRLNGDGVPETVGESMVG